MPENPAKRRYYTVDEANAAVGRLSDLFSTVMQLRGLLKRLYQRLDTAGYPIQQQDLDADEQDTAAQDEDIPEQVVRDRVAFRGLVDTLKEHVEAIQKTGCVIKDIETGLVDWLATHEGREVWLCWKYGESEIVGWHELHTGFAERRSISELVTSRGATPPPKAIR